MTMSKKTTLSLTAIREDGRVETANVLGRLIDLANEVGLFHHELDAASERTESPLDARLFWAVDAVNVEVERALCEAIVLACGEGPREGTPMNNPTWALSGTHECEVYDDRDGGDRLIYSVCYGEDEETGDWVPNLTVSA